MRRGTRLGVGERRMVVAGLGVLAWVVGLIWIFPIAWTVFTSFKSEQDAASQTLHHGLGFGRYSDVAHSTPGTLSLIFQVTDRGTPRTVAFSGGTEFNFVNDVPHFDLYIASARKFAAAAASAGATILMTNQSEFDNAATKLRLLKDRHPGEAHPLEVVVEQLELALGLLDRRQFDERHRALPPGAALIIGGRRARCQIVSRRAA